MSDKQNTFIIESYFVIQRNRTRERERENEKSRKREMALDVKVLQGINIKRVVGNMKKHMKEEQAATTNIHDDRMLNETEKKIENPDLVFVRSP